MGDFTINDHHYRCRKLNARQQFHVMRRMAPIAGPVAVLQFVMESIFNRPDEMTEEDINNRVNQMMPSLEALARAPEEDMDYIINVCMAATVRQQGGNGSGQVVWSEVWNAQAKREMFDDIDMMEMLGIVLNVVMDNLRNFTSIRQQPSADLATPTPAPAASVG